MCRLRVRCARCGPPERGGHPSTRLPGELGPHVRLYHGVPQATLRGAQPHRFSRRPCGRQAPALRERHRQQPKRLLVSAAAEPAGWERTSGFRSEQELVRVSSWQSTTVVPPASRRERDVQTSVRGWKEFAYFNQMPFRKKINTVSRIKHQCEHIRVLAQTHHSLRSSLREAGAGLLLVIRRRLLLLVALATELAEVQHLDGVDRLGVVLLVHPNTVCLRRPVPHREPAPFSACGAWCAASSLRASCTDSHSSQAARSTVLTCTVLMCALCSPQIDAQRAWSRRPKEVVCCFS